MPQLSIEEISTSQRLAQLATTRAGASRVFQRHRLDFCCGGQRDLATACADRGLDPQALLAEIEREAPGPAPLARWDRRAAGDLVEHILARFHRPHRQELARLLPMARKVEQVHAGKASCPRGLADHVERMREELEMHMQKEEQVLFPLIQSGATRAARMPVQVMEGEHRDHARNLAKLDSLTCNYTAPPEACATWSALYLGLLELEQELMLHIHLENNVLFPKVLHEEDCK
ncbi:MAG: iron-sulfur cluster repair protein YtfE [Deltaproteobacteria bacterium]|nr:iron-sulfur cluster repair protein YtfE [Deltaproteobacteria bacterium]